MIISYIESSVWLLCLLIFFSQIILFVCGKHTYLLSIYFIFVAIICGFLYITRSSDQEFLYNNIISPTDGIVVEVANSRTVTLYNKKYTGLLMYVQSGLLDEWSKIAPVSGKINYIRHYEDPYNKQKILSIAIQTKKNIHLLQFILKSALGNMLFNLQSNIYEGCNVQVGQVIAIAPVQSEMRWFIEYNNQYYINVPQGRKLKKYEYIPLKQCEHEDDQSSNYNHKIIYTKSVNPKRINRLQTNNPAKKSNNNKHSNKNHNAQLRDRNDCDL